MPSQSTAEMLPNFIVVLAALSLLPFLLTMLTSFAKIVIVGGIVRQAVGTPQIPPTIVITGLALILTVHIMAPVALSIKADAEALTTISRAKPEVLDTVYARIVKSLPANAGPAPSPEGIFTDTSPTARWLRQALAKDPALKSGPAANESSSAPEAIDFEFLAVAVRGPLEEFLRRHAAEQHIQLFSRLQSKLLSHQGLDPDPKSAGMPEALRTFVVLAPAFVLTELTEAFMIGFLIFVPFLVVDLVVSNVLLAMGMQMLTPTMVSLPLKLLVFVVMDGWSLILRGIVSGYA